MSPIRDDVIKRDNESFDAWVESGEKQPSSQLYARIEKGLAHALKTMATSALADDVLQAAGEKIIRGLQDMATQQRYSEQSSGYAKEEKVARWNRQSPLDSWASKVTRNLFKDVVKSAWVRKSVSLEETDNRDLASEIVSLSPENLLILYQGQEQLRGCLSELLQSLNSPNVEVFHEMQRMIEEEQRPTVSKLSRRLTERYPRGNYYRKKVRESLEIILSLIRVKLSTKVEG